MTETAVAIPKEEDVQKAEMSSMAAANEMRSMALAVTVNNAIAMGEANDTLAAVIGVRKQIEAELATWTEPQMEIRRIALATKKKYEERYAPILTVVGEAEHSLRNKMQAWQIAEDVRVAEEKRKAEEEAEKERKRLEDLRLAAEKREREKLAAAMAEKDEKRRKELERQAEIDRAKAETFERRKEETAPTPVAPPAEKPKGFAVVKTYSAEVTDIVALCRYVVDNPKFADCVTPNTTKLNQMARALKDAMDIPGVKLIVKSGSRKTTA